MDLQGQRKEERVEIWSKVQKDGNIIYNMEMIREKKWDNYLCQYIPINKTPRKNMYFTLGETMINASRCTQREKLPSEFVNSDVIHFLEM